MKKIPLTQGKYALVDDNIYQKIIKFKWYAVYERGRWYAKTTVHMGYINKKRIKCNMYMHRYILHPPHGYDVDHINRNGLDNRSINLRACTRSQNLINSTRNRHSKNTKPTSEYKGVYWRNDKQKWAARISIKGQETYLGLYDNEVNASYAYDAYAKKHYKEYALLNH
jgi:hypothetical protein